MKDVVFKFFIVSLIFLTGCSGKLHYAGKGFEPSQSLCVDALLVNMDKAGCNIIYYGYSPSHGAFKVRCIDSSKVDSNDDWVSHEWTTYSFFISPSFASPELHAKLSPICSDRNVTVYFLNEN
ncbi:hypothetical protein CMI47_19190 [Candidatus Pacearchaeota archaeon]|nr:hypothetical protein [Candidatus Pacearchaeota archaeon]|tara:strand:+ start:9069 stop:9437 length:369 start_codon:yes stop_codon:yes gene_type:complete